MHAKLTPSIQTEARDIINSRPTVYIYMYTGTCTHILASSIYDGQHCNKIQLGQAIHYTVYVDQSQTEIDCLN